MSDSDESDLDDYFPSSSGSEYDALCWGWLEGEGYESMG
ncbi:hypothetical protein AVEN_95922-1, partial [Araneus ventricosus]